MSLINPILGIANFNEKIAQLATQNPYSMSDVMDAFHELGESNVAGAVGYVLMDTTARPIESIEYPQSPIPATQFASTKMCILYRDVITTGKMMVRDEPEHVYLTYADMRVMLSPLAIKGLFLVVLFSIPSPKILR